MLLCRRHALGLFLVAAFTMAAVGSAETTSSKHKNAVRVMDGQGVSDSTRRSLASTAKSGAVVTLATIQTGVTIAVAVANMFVSLYKAYVFNKFKTFVAGLREDVVQEIQAAMKVFSDTMEAFHQKTKEIEPKITKLASGSGITKEERGHLTAIAAALGAEFVEQKEGKLSSITMTTNNMVVDNVQNKDVKLVVADPDEAHRDLGRMMLQDFPVSWALLVYEAINQFAKDTVEDVKAKGRELAEGLVSAAIGAVSHSKKQSTIVEALSSAIGGAAASQFAGSMMTVSKMVLQIYELGQNIKDAIDFKATLKEMYPEYEDEMINGPAKDVRYAMCKTLSSVSLTLEADINRARDSFDNLSEALSELAVILTHGFKSDELNCAQFVNYPAPPATDAPICRLFNPGDFKHVGWAGPNGDLCTGAHAAADRCTWQGPGKPSSLIETRVIEKERRGTTTGRLSSGKQEMLRIRHSATALPKDEDRNKFPVNDKGVSQVDPSVLRSFPDFATGHGVARADKNGDDPSKPGRKCEPITSLQQIYGNSFTESAPSTALNIMTGGALKRDNKEYGVAAVSTTGHFGLRLYTAILHGDRQSLAFKNKEDELRNKFKFSKLQSELDWYAKRSNAWSRDVRAPINPKDIIEPFNFVQDRRATVTKRHGWFWDSAASRHYDLQYDDGKEPKTSSKVKAKDLRGDSANGMFDKGHKVVTSGGKEAFVLVTYSPGAPVTRVKSGCSTAERTPCTRLTQAYGSCGWRNVPKIWYTNTEPGKIRMCYLKSWHVADVVAGGLPTSAPATTSIKPTTVKPTFKPTTSTSTTTPAPRPATTTTTTTKRPWWGF